MKTSIMRSLLFVAAIVAFVASQAQSVHAFTTVTAFTFKTDNPGVSASDQVTIPVDTNFTYNYNINWGDGHSDLAVTGSITHTYASAGTYTVSILGTFPAIFFNDGSGTDAAKLLSIDNWGTNHWLSMYAAFAGCSNMVDNATGAPDLSGVTNTAYMFLNDANFDADLSGWDVSTVTTMYGMFQSTIFNQDLSAWNVSSVTDMDHMFDNNTVFNQDLSMWDVSSVSDFSYMFFGATSFDWDISAWVTASATDMSGMFDNATSFNADISSWNVTNVTNMSHMFDGATAFNQDISTWTTSSATNMAGMFAHSTFNQDIASFDTGSVTDMSTMFYHDTAFDKDLSSWDVSSVTNMNSMFEGATSMNSPLSWGSGTSNVTNMRGMFTGAVLFNQDITAWNTSSVTTMAYMFSGASAFNQDIGGWTTSLVTDMQFMFASSPFDQDISGWDTTHVTNMQAMFYNDTAFNQDISSWETGSVITMDSMFDGASSFNQDLSSWDVSNVTTMYAMFLNATSFNSPLAWGSATSQVGNTAWMFANDSLFDQDISGWDMGSATTMYDMLANASSFDQPIGSWDTSEATNMSAMLAGATSFDQDVSGWDVSHVTAMDGIFNAVTLSLLNYNKLLFYWANQDVQSGVTFDGGNSTYCRVASRAILTDTHHWTITDGGVDGGCPSMTLTEVVPIPSRVHASEAVYYFTASAGVDAAVADGTGSYSATPPTCRNCTLSFDTTNHTVTISNLSGGDRIDFNLFFTDTNTLEVGLFTVNGLPSGGANGGGGTHYGCTDPHATNYETFSKNDPALCVYKGEIAKPDTSGARGMATTAPASKLSFVFARTLTTGSTHPDVLELQKKLNALGFVVAQTGPGSKGNETNYFGAKTKAAVMAFQKAKGLPPVGIVGPRTRALLNSLQ